MAEYCLYRRRCVTANERHLNLNTKSSYRKSYALVGQFRALLGPKRERN